MHVRENSFKIYDKEKKQQQQNKGTIIYNWNNKTANK